MRRTWRNHARVRAGGAGENALSPTPSAIAAVVAFPPPAIPPALSRGRRLRGRCGHSPEKVMQVSRAAGPPAPPNFNVRVGEAREFIFLAAAAFVSTLKSGGPGGAERTAKVLALLFQGDVRYQSGGGGHSADPVPTRPRLYHVI